MAATGYTEKQIKKMMGTLTAGTKPADRQFKYKPQFGVIIVCETEAAQEATFNVKHHYLKLPRMVAAEYFVGFVEGQPVCHLAVAPRLEIHAMRACRMVVLPEWQCAGIGLRFLNEVCRHYVTGGGRYGTRAKAVYCPTDPADKLRIFCENAALGYHPSLLPLHRERDAVRLGGAPSGACHRRFYLLA